MMAFEEQDYRGAKDTGKKPGGFVRIVIWVLAVIAVILVVSMGFSILVDYVQVREIGAAYTSVFWTNIRIKLVAQALSFLVIFVLFMANNMVIRQISLKTNDDLAFIRRLTPVVLLTFIVSFIASRFISDTVYTQFLMFANSTAFNQTDPVFFRDIGYYLFQRPFAMSLIDSVKTTLIIQAVYTAIIYFMLHARNGIENFADIFHQRGIMVHNIINILLVFISIALSFRFMAEQVLYGSFSGFFGAGFTDIYVWIKYYDIAPWLLLAVVVSTVFFLAGRRIKAGLISVAVFPATWLLTLLIAGIVQMFVVAPNDMAAESPNILNNIYMTRAAYGLDKIAQADFPIENTLTQEDLQDNAATMDNIRIVDFNANLVALNKLQAIRQYYTFHDTDITSYDVDGRLTAVSVAAREIDKERLSGGSAEAYTNRTFKYTHGYGVVANPINKITSEGQPDFIIKGMPVQSDPGVVDVAQPRIYYGELASDHVIVNSKIKELDYSEGQSSAEFSYDGQGGIKLNSWNRILFSMIYGDYKMLVSGQITPQSKLLPNRNVLERVKRVAPFFAYDTDPYIVVTDDGRLKWVIDGYATSEHFPYAQKTDKINYIRNSFKVVVDAYDGTVDFYIVDPSDPVVQTYARAYPTLFKSIPMPEDIWAHVRYSERLFKIQAQMYKRYHVTDAQIFYNRTDIWDTAKERYSKSDSQYIEPYYNVINIKGFNEDGESLLLTMPYTIENRDYTNGWLAVGSDSKYYGRMVFYRFINAEKNAYGTLQMENRIDNDPSISSQMTLWGQGGSSVVRGNMMVIPVKDSLLYIEPVYITTQNTAAFPELKRVIVAYKENIAMEATLKEALDKIFGVEQANQGGKKGSGKTTAATPVPAAGETQINADTAVLFGQIVELYGKYKQYNAENDFENAGKAMRDLDDYMQQAQQMLGLEAVSPAPSQTPQASAQPDGAPASAGPALKQ